MSEIPIELVPARYRAKCQFCGLELDVRAEGTHQFVKGWVKNRSGGGGHGVSLPERENRWAHSWCVDRETRGAASQDRLFGD
jgi:hypothetical protein